MPQGARRLLSAVLRSSGLWAGPVLCVQARAAAARSPAQGGMAGKAAKTILMATAGVSRQRLAHGQCTRLVNGSDEVVGEQQLVLGAASFVHPAVRASMRSLASGQVGPGTVRAPRHTGALQRHAEIRLLLVHLVLCLPCLLATGAAGPLGQAAGQQVAGRHACAARGLALLSWPLHNPFGQPRRCSDGSCVLTCQARGAML